MVRLFDGGIDLAIVRFPVGRAKHIVDAHVDGIAIERTPDAVGGGHIGICEPRRGDAMAGIRNGRIVEITAKDDALASLEQALHVGRRDNGLARAYHRRIGDFGDEHARTGFGRAILWIDHHLVVLRTVVLREVHALQMAIDDMERIMRRKQKGEIRRTIGRARVADALFRDDGIAREAGERAGGKIHGVGIGELLAENGLHIGLVDGGPGMRFLHTENVGTLALHIGTDDIGACFILGVGRKAVHIIGYDLHSALWRRRGHVDGHIVANGKNAAAEAK